MKVKDCMCNDVCSVKPDTKVCEVAKLMKQNHIGAIPVCDDNKMICGIVTDRDIVLRSVACDKDVKNIPVSDIMTCNVCTCNEDDEMKQAESKMANYQVRRLPVCDTSNRVIGILTLGDLAQNDMQLGKQNVCDTISDICNCNVQAKNAE